MKMMPGLRTWALDIVDTLLGHPTVTELLHDRRYPNGLLVHRRTGIWNWFSKGKGGHSLIPLIALLTDGSYANAVLWARAWRAAHPGRGGCDGADPGPDEDSASEAIREANQARCRELLDQCVPIEGTPGHRYLLGRLPGAPDDFQFPDFVRWLPSNIARYGEGAIATLLHAGDVVGGLELRFITEQGEKSRIEPTSQIFKLEVSDRAKAATIGRLPSPTELKATYAKANTPPLLICEGLPDFLSLQLALPEYTVIALPGVSILLLLWLAKGVRITVCRDGDLPGSAPDKALIAGIDALLLQGAEVSVTSPPEGKDSNDVLQEGGIAELRALVNAATPASLSLEGEGIRCANLSDIEYENVRKPTAARLKVRAPALDIARNEALRRRSRHAKQEAEQAEQTAAAWSGDINLNKALETAISGLKKHIVMPEHDLAVGCLFTVHCHLCRRDAVGMQLATHLKAQSRTPGSGKTSFLEKLAALLPDNEMLSKYTPAYFVRAFHDAAAEGRSPPIMVIDEADRNISEGDPMVTLLNAATRRGSANAGQMMAAAGNKWNADDVNFFGPVLIAGIDDDPPTVRDRAILLLLDKALGHEMPAHVLTSERPDLVQEAPELTEAKAHIAAWASIQTGAPTCKCPDFLLQQPDRTVRNWWLLYAIANAAGGRWPNLIETAAKAALGRERPLVQLERLLLSIKRCFDKQDDVVRSKGAADRAANRAANDKDRVETQTLLVFLNAEIGEEWNRANRGGIVTEYWLRDRLLNLLKPRGSQHWHTGAGKLRKDHYGYERHQFEDAWLRHISFLEQSPKTSHPSHPSHPGSQNNEETQGTQPGCDAPDDPTQQTHPEQPTRDTNHQTTKRIDRFHLYETDLPGHSPGNGFDAQDAGGDANFDPTQQQSASEARFSGSGFDGCDGCDVSEDSSKNQKSRSALEVKLEAVRAQHPDWSPKKLATHLRQSEWLIKELIAAAAMGASS